MVYDVTFTTSDGITINLNDGVNTFIPVGLGGEMMPQFEFQENTSPLIAGSIISAVRITPRALSLPLMIVDDDWFTALQRARSLLKQLNPLRGDGELHVNFDPIPGSYRVLKCRYRDGFINEGQGNDQFTNYCKAVISFYASDPFWYESLPTVLMNVNPVNPPTFFPLFPLRLASAQTDTDATLVNAGDVPAWPIFTITGPGSRFIATNVTTGKVLDVTATLTESDTITVDTRPRTRSVRDNTGANRFSTLSNSSSFWPLEQGYNYVTLQIIGGTVATFFAMRYTPAYLTV